MDLECIKVSGLSIKIVVDKPKQIVPLIKEHFAMFWNFQGSGSTSEITKMTIKMLQWLIAMFNGVHAKARTPTRICEVTILR